MMIMRKKIYRMVAILMTLVVSLLILPLDMGRVAAKDYDNTYFEDNRFRKEDGTKYIRIKDVTNKSAQVLLYDVHPDKSFVDNFDPAQDKLFAEWCFMTEAVDSSFDDIDIPSCINVCMACNTEDGRIVLYLSPDGKKLYLRDGTMGKYGDINGIYHYVPYNSDELIAQTRNNRVQRELALSAVNEANTNDEDVEYIRVNVPYIDMYENHEYDEVFWEQTLSELSSSVFISFSGVSWVENASIADEDLYKDYHLNRRKPWHDSSICKTAEDEEMVIQARRELFLGQKGIYAGDINIVFYNDAKTNKSVFELHLPRNKQEKAYKTLDFSWGEGDVGYEFGTIEYFERKDSALDERSMYVDEANNRIVLKQSMRPEMHYTGGIAYEITCEVYIYFNNDGTAFAEGYVRVNGEGSEELLYNFKAGAVELAVAVENLAEDKFVGSCVIVDEANEYKTNVVETKISSRVTAYNAWPDDTDVDPLPEYEGGDGGVDNIYEDGDDNSDGSMDSGEDEGTGLSSEEILPEEFPEDGEQYGWIEPEEEITEEEIIEEEIIEEEVYGDGKCCLGIEQDLSNDEFWMLLDTLNDVPSSKIKSVTATSELEPSGGKYRAQNAVDGKLGTAWVEGTSGDGIGESITIEFEESIELAGVLLANGYFKSNDTYKNNGRIEWMTIRFDDGEEEMVDLTDSMYQTVNSNDFVDQGIAYNDIVIFARTHKVKSVSFVIVSAVSGKKYSDTCLSEIYFLSK